MRKILLALAITAPLLAGCPSMPPAEPRKNLVEQILDWDKKAQAAEKSVDQLTCHKGYDAAGLCLEAGKPLKPAVGLDLLESLAKVRGALRMAVMIPQDGVGPCLDKKDLTGAQCLQAASLLFLDVEATLRKQLGG
jgi:hypothetical protein